MSAFVVAVLLSLVSAVAYAAGAILQERVAVDTPDRPYAPLRKGGWWVAVLLNAFGGLLHAGALTFGPLSLVQPMGALTIVFALPMAALFTHHRAGPTAWRGAVLTTVGLAGLLALTRDSHPRALDGHERLLLAAVSVGAVAVLFVTAGVARGRTLRSVLLAAAGGVAFGVSSVFVKTVAVGWSTTAWSLQLPTMGAVAVLAISGLLLSQASYRGAGLAAPLAVVTVVNPVVATVVGLTLFDEGFRYGVVGAVAATAFGVLATTGLVVLTRGRALHPTDDGVRTPSDPPDGPHPPAAAGDPSHTRRTDGPPERGAGTDGGHGRARRGGPRPKAHRVVVPRA